MWGSLFLLQICARRSCGSFCVCFFLKEISLMIFFLVYPPPRMQSSQMKVSKDSFLKMFHVILVVTIASWVGGKSKWWIFCCLKLQSVFQLLKIAPCCSCFVVWTTWKLRFFISLFGFGVNLILMQANMPQRKRTVEYLEEVCVQ